MDGAARPVPGAALEGVMLSNVLLFLLFLRPSRAEEPSAAPPAAGAEAPAQADAPAETTPDPSDHLAWDERRAEAIEALIAGKLPENLSVEQLFEVDPVDEAAVARRVGELDAQIAALQPAAGATLSDRDAATLRLARARRAFMQLPADRRAAVVQATQHLRETRLAAGEAASKKAAAEAEAAAARAAQEQALQQAQEAAAAVEREVAGERARLERARAELAQQAATAASSREQALAARTALVGRLHAASEALSVAEDAAARDAAFDEANAVWVAADQGLTAALDALDARPQPLSLSPDPALLDRAGEAGAALTQLASEINATSAGQIADQRHAAEIELQSAESLADDALDLRDRAYAGVSDAYRARLRGLSDAAVEAMRAEGRHAVVRLRRLRVDAGLLLAEPTRLLSSVDALVRLLGGSLRLLLALLGTAAAVRYADPLASAVARVLRARGISAPLARPMADEIERIGDDVLPAVALLLGTLAVGGVLGALRDNPIVAFAYGIALWYAGYRLVVTLAERLASARPSSRELHPGAVRAVRRLGAYVFGAGVVLATAQTVLSLGVLLGHLRGLSWLGGLVLAGTMLVLARAELSGAFLDVHPEGRLADGVRKGQTRWFGAPLALIALVWLTLENLALSARRGAMRFVQLRRALAEVFRTRLERAAAAQEAPAAPPAALASRFAELPLAHDDPWLVLPAGALARLDAALERWQRDDRRTTAILVGEEGAGRSTWLATALAGVRETVVHVDVGAPTRDPTEVLSRLASALAAPSGDVDGLVSWLLGQPRRLIVLDDVHRWFERAPGGGEGWSALCRVISATADSHAWLATAAAHPLAHLRWARRELPFDLVVRVEPRDEAGMNALLRARVADLSLDVSRLLGAGGGADSGARDVRGAALDDYLRLIWHYADGDPAVGLEAWGRSLLERDGAISVVLFARPDAEVLEQLADHERFVLAAAVWNGFLSASSAARCLGFPERRCAAAISALVDQGVLRALGGWWRIEPRWRPTVIAFLRRQNLLHT